MTSLRDEVERLRARLLESEQTLDAIRRGEVDSLVVQTAEGPRIYALESTANAYRVLLESMAEGAATLSPAGVILYCNGRLASLVGRPLQDVMGASLRGLLADGHESAGDALLRTDAESHVETCLRAAGGGDVPVYVSSRALCVDAENVICLVVVDLRPQKHAEAVLESQRALRESEERERAARAEAEDANRTKDNFLAMLSHELRNPLAPILTALHLLRQRSDHGIARELDVIDRQAHHLVRLVDDLLDVSRIARGKVALDRVGVEIGDVIAAAIEMASPVIENNRHRLIVDAPGQGLGVVVDFSRMAQVIGNLLTNAAKYTPVGGTIFVFAVRDRDEVVIEVEDTGAGISPELLPHIFELFVQGEQTIERSRGGLGLGLSIVKNLVALHGGTATAESGGLGKGSKFAVRLPAADVIPSVPPASLPTPKPAARGRRVLIVDDNADAADMLAETLDGLGYATAVAHDGPEALSVAQIFEPDAALLDIGLPVMDGYELAQRLLQKRAGRELLLVAITGYSRDVDRQRAREAGFQRHLTKPVDLDALAVLLEQSAPPPSPAGH